MSDINPNTTFLSIPNGSCNIMEYTTFDTSQFLLLEELNIGNNCFSNVDKFVINGLNHLKSLIIGINSFTAKKSGWEKDKYSQTFSVLNCIELKSIEIGSNCFSDYGILFELDNLPKLSTIKIGDNCFCLVNEFILNELNHLKALKIGTNSFTKKNNRYGNNSSRSFGILNCIELESIEIDSGSFSDYEGNFELKNLPKLSTIKMESFNFRYSSFEIKGITDMILLMNRSSTFEFDYIRKLCIQSFLINSDIKYLND